VERVHLLGRAARSWRAPRRIADLVDVQPALRRYAVDVEMVVLT
jgi:hypothetical protein